MEQNQLYELANEDLPRYYKHTFIRYAPKDNPEAMKWVFVDEIMRMTPAHKSVAFSFNHTGAWTSVADGIFNLEFPEIGNFNFENRSFRVVRSPRRQFKKALCNDNYHIGNPVLSSQGYPVPSKLRFSWEIVDINKMFNLGAPSGIGAIPHFYDSLMNKKTLISRALDKDISISLGTIGKDPDVWFRTHRVGKLLAADVIALESDIFKEEFKDRCVPHQIEVVVR